MNTKLEKLIRSGIEEFNEWGKEDFRHLYYPLVAESEKQFEDLHIPMSFDQRILDVEFIDWDLVRKHSPLEVLKAGMKGDFIINKNVAECPRCRKHTPECHFDNKHYKRTGSMCDRCNIAVRALKQ